MDAFPGLSASGLYATSNRATFWAVWLFSTIGGVFLNLLVSGHAYKYPIHVAAVGLPKYSYFILYL
jgi:hypothetical protein